MIELYRRLLLTAGPLHWQAIDLPEFKLFVVTDCGQVRRFSQSHIAHHASCTKHIDSCPQETRYSNRTAFVYAFARSPRSLLTPQSNNNLKVMRCHWYTARGHTGKCVITLRTYHTVIISFETRHLAKVRGAKDFAVKHRVRKTKPILWGIAKGPSGSEQHG
jgi:hypothetical protein